MELEPPRASPLSMSTTRLLPSPLDTVPYPLPTRAVVELGVMRRGGGQGELGVVRRGSGQGGTTRLEAAAGRGARTVRGRSPLKDLVAASAALVFGHHRSDAEN
jgi:hypothetical protein